MVLAVGKTEVGAAWQRLVETDVHDMLDELPYSLVLACSDRHDRHSERAFQRIDVDRPPVLAHFVHHVQRNHHRLVQLHQLGGQIQVALDVGRIDDVYYPVDVVLDYEVARDDLLTGVRGERIDAGKVRDRDLLMPPYPSILAVDRDAGEVAHMLVTAGKLVEQRRLAAVLVPDEGQRERRARLAARTLGKSALLSEVRMDGSVYPPSDHILVLVVMGFVYPFHLYVLGLAPAYGQAVAAHPDLYGVSKRCALEQGDLHSGSESHLQNMLSEGDVPGLHTRYHGILAYGKL